MLRREHYMSEPSAVDGGDDGEAASLRDKRGNRVSKKAALGRKNSQHERLARSQARKERKAFEASPWLSYVALHVRALEIVQSGLFVPLVRAHLMPYKSSLSTVDG